MSVHICAEPMHEIVRRPARGKQPRWCFVCRKRRQFLYVVDAPVDPMSWYGPTPHVECGTCGTYDGDLFPGREREWEG